MRRKRPNNQFNRRKSSTSNKSCNKTEFYLKYIRGLNYFRRKLCNNIEISSEWIIEWWSSLNESKEKRCNQHRCAVNSEKTIKTEIICQWQHIECCSKRYRYACWFPKTNNFILRQNVKGEKTVQHFREWLFGASTNEWMVSSQPNSECYFLFAECQLFTYESKTHFVERKKKSTVPMINRIYSPDKLIKPPLWM